MARYSVEMLVHFKCEVPECGRWWTIGDFVIDMHKRIHCPWCGIEQRIIQVHETIT